MKLFNILFYIYVTLYFNGIKSPTSYRCTTQKCVVLLQPYEMDCEFMFCSQFSLPCNVVTLKHLLRQNLNLKWDSLFYLQFIS